MARVKGERQAIGNGKLGSRYGSGKSEMHWRRNWGRGEVGGKYDYRGGAGKKWIKKGIRINGRVEEKKYNIKARGRGGVEDEL